MVLSGEDGGIEPTAKHEHDICACRSLRHVHEQMTASRRDEIRLEPMLIKSATIYREYAGRT
jgi:hypothetical protein